MQSPELDPIRNKVELVRKVSDEAPPRFEIASNDSFPTPDERQIIAKWAALRDECIKRFGAISRVPPSASPLVTAFVQQDAAFGNEASARVSELVIALYQQKLTYGEFAQKRYDISRQATLAERQFRESRLIADQERQARAQQLAQQQFQNNLIAWSAYMQTVNARQPQAVHLEGSVRVRTNCTSQQIGSFRDTSCY